MTKLPVRLTVLVPTYHRPALLRRAVESVQAQQFADYILRIHDNGTDAETLALAQELMATDSRIEYRRNSVNLGAEGNISQLIASVDTPYFCFLCDDDVILPGFLAAAMDGFATHPDIGFSAARTVLVHLQGSYIRWRNRDWRPGRHAPGALAMRQMAASHFTSTAVLYHNSLRERLIAVADFSDDRLFSIIAAGIVPFHVADVTGGVFVIHPQSNSVLQGVSGHRSLGEHLDRLRRLLDKAPGMAVPGARAQLRLAIASAFLRYVRQRLRADHRDSQPLPVRSARYRADLYRILACYGAGTILQALAQLPISGAMGLFLWLRGGKSAKARRLPLPPATLPYLNGDRSARTAFEEAMKTTDAAQL